MNVTERFLKYVSYDTQSRDVPEAEGQYPSSKKQLILLGALCDELNEMGIQASIDEYGYVMGKIPANTDRDIPKIGFVAHADTATEISGKNVRPRIIENYDGSDIVLNEELGVVMTTEEFGSLKKYVGDDIIVTDGTTLLGADDKAGIAEIMAMAEYVINHPEFIHGDILIGFTPDEEVGGGTLYFDVNKFGADIAYTVDGGPIGEVEYENFNAASAVVRFYGRNIHPGTAKGKMKNASLIAMEFQSMLPVFENPMYTEGYEGFSHMNEIHGTVEEAKMSYIIRDHDLDLLNEKKERFYKIAEFLNFKYGEGTVVAEVKDSYYNMKQHILPHMHLIDNACEAMNELGITPVIVPIRGGTDGAALSNMGLPCPNLATGGENFHGKYEYISIQSMEKSARLLLKILEIYARQEKI
ncbi:MAG: peptidase T [Eubacteriaceae bacterium]|nr:peptidase T [Eubacteriaceae bacterium]